MKEKLVRLYNFSNSWTGTIIIVLLIIFFVAQAFVIPSGSMISTLLIGDHLFVKKFAYGVPTPRVPFLEIPLIPNSDGHLIDGDRPQRGDIVIFRYPLNNKVHFVKRCVATGGDEIFLHSKDLYLKPKEGNDYVKTTFKGYETLELNGSLWVKNPYEKEHAGIHSDKSEVKEFASHLPPQIASDILEPKMFYTLNGGKKILFDQNELMGDTLMVKGAGQQAQPIEVDGRVGRLFFFGPFKVPENEFFMMGDNRDHSADSRFWGPVKYSEIVGKPWFIYFSWDDDYKIRWDRIGMSVHGLEQELLEKRGKQ